MLIRASIKATLIVAALGLAACQGSRLTNGLDLTNAPVAPAMPPVATPCDAGNMSGCAAGARITLRGVNFQVGKAALTSDAKDILDGVAATLVSQSAVHVQVAGHTDGTGAEAANQALSERRARAVVRYLVSHGVGADRLEAVGYGESMPVADDGTPEGRELNRRVELKVLGGPAPYAAAPAATPAEPVTAPAPAHAHHASTTVAEPPSMAAAAGGDVTIRDHQFQPQTTVISSGGTVAWTNQDGSSHSIAFDDVTSSTLRASDRYERTFAQAGEYPYRCGIHPDMRGVVRVL
jgi:outer membrane protein OmpA-like peptidoglycan-associated protein/plastocyanin